MLDITQASEGDLLTLVAVILAQPHELTSQERQELALINKEIRRRSESALSKT